MTEPFNAAPCYVCGSIDCSSAKVVFDDSNTMVLCQHCAVHGINMMSTRRQIEVYPPHIALLNTIDSLGTSSYQNIVAMFANRQPADRIEEAIDRGVISGYIACCKEKIRLTTRGKNLIDEYNADFRREYNTDRSVRV